MNQSAYENIFAYLHTYEILPQWQDLKDVIKISVNYEFEAHKDTYESWAIIFRLSIPMIEWECNGKTLDECLNKTLYHLRNDKIERAENVHADKQA